VLELACPPGHEAARRWVFEQLFGRFLGLTYRVTPRAALDHVEIGLPNGHCIRVCEQFFAHSEDHWLQAQTLPAMPLQQADFSADAVAAALVEPVLPVLYGRPCGNGAWIDRRAENTELGIDVFGSAFVLLSRCEELVRRERDAHDRLPVEVSLAGQAGFVERPLVDETLELLWTLIDTAAAGSVARRRDAFRVQIEHDVDAPFKYLFCNVPALLRTEASALLRRQEAPSLHRNVALWRRVRHGDLLADPYNSFDFLMAQSEARGWLSSFYFIAERPAGWRDGLYEIDHPAISALLRSMWARGHTIGLHGSYASATSDTQLAREKQRLEAACAPFAPPGWRVERSRQHYLRFDAGRSPGAWAAAGIRLDLSLSFAQQAGFRCGTSRRFGLFDLRRRVPLPVDEQPLIAMDTSLLHYQGLAAAAVPARVDRLARRVAAYGGCFVLLWHNSMLTTPLLRQTYTDVLDVLRRVQVEVTQVAPAGAAPLADRR
jgi:hypothetical protein